MAKILFGADFKDEDYTSGGKPKPKKKVDDSENTGEIDIPVPTEQPKPEGAAAEEAPAESGGEEKKPPAPKKKSAAKKEPEPDPYEDWLLSKESARIVSILLFAVGILCGLLTIIPGAKGWKVLHDGMLGLFGFISLVVPAEFIYASVIIGQYLRKTRTTITQMVAATFITCAAFEIFFVGTSPDDGLPQYFRMLLDNGAQYKGGGAISAFIAYPLMLWFGRTGAAIIISLIIFTAAVIISGKELSDVFHFVTHPFENLGGVMDRLAENFFPDDEEEDEDDEEDDDDEDDVFSIHMSSGETISTSLTEEIAEEAPPEPQKLPKLSRAKSSEDDELDVFFGAPQPVSKGDFYDDESRESVSELDMLISKAAQKKPSDVEDDVFIEVSYDDVPDDEEAEPEYTIPDISLLTPPDNSSNSAEAEAEMHEKAKKIVSTFQSFGVEVSIKDIYRGPTITRYEIQPGTGVKVSKIRGLEDDIALSLAAHGVRIEAPVPGKAAVGIEVPNVNKDTVTIREILQTNEFRRAESKLAFAVGKDITGNAIIGDITKMPHVIIAGTTGSGKSVCTRSIIMSILYNAKPDEVKIILIDPKVVEFKVFEGLPHLLIPIVTEAKKAAGALNWAVNEMMRRYNTFADNGVNDLRSYNEYAEEEELKRLPQIVVFIDELADMMLVAGKEVEDSICRLAQMGRAAGIHLVVATQRPTTDVITGLIKANIPSRIALSVKSQVDSRTIIDMGGADKLLGNGDMLYMPIGFNKPVRIQGCFASNKDINATLEYIRRQAKCEYDSQILDAVENFVPQTKGDHGSADSGFDSGSDEDYIIRAAELAVNAGQLSTTMVQRKLKLGYARASRIVDEMEERGIIGPSEGAKPRKVMMSKMQFDEWKTRKMEG